jgi:hypothetical protein
MLRRYPLDVAAATLLCPIERSPYLRAGLRPPVWDKALLAVRS